MPNTPHSPPHCFSFSLKIHFSLSLLRRVRAKLLFTSFFSSKLVTFFRLCSLHLWYLIHYISHLFIGYIYPLKDYVGNTTCYMLVYGRDIGIFITQLHSLFMATFRYVCLFHDNLLLKFNLTAVFLKLVQ